MLFKTIGVFRDQIVYTQIEPTKWRAEFRGHINITVEGPSVERCRFIALDQFDDRLSEWLRSTSSAATPMTTSSHDVTEGQ